MSARSGISLAARWGLMIALAAGPAQAVDGGEIARDGTAAGAPACAACHGVDGGGTAELGVPRLAGVAAGYIAHELDSFGDGSRKNAIMAPIAEALRTDERAAVATFYATRAAPQRAASAIDGELAARGRVLAEAGDWARGLPGCDQCHGPAGQGVGAPFPALANQPASYLSAQLAAWKDGTRRNDPLGLMAGLAVKLSATDIAAVSAYYASLPVPPAGGVR